MSLSNFINKIFFAGLFLVGWFLWPVIAYGATFETYDIVATPSDGTLIASGNPRQQFLIPTSSQGDFISVVIDFVDVGCDDVLTLRDRTTSVSYFLHCDFTGLQFSRYTTTTQFSLLPNHEYELFYSNYNSGRRSPSSTYTNTSGWDKGGRRTSIPNGVATDSDYDIYMRLNIEPQLQDEIDFVKPSGISEDLVCDFSFWEVEYLLSNTTTNANNGEYGISVQSGIDPVSLPFQDFAWFTGADSLAFPARTFIPKAGTLDTGFTYYAQAHICDSIDPDDCDFSLQSNQDHLVASSPVWQFIVDDPDAPLLNCPTDGSQILYPRDSMPFVTSTAAGDTNTCDTNSDFFSRGMCSMFQWLFVPAPSTITAFSDLKEQVQNKPPFGYVTVFSAQIGNLSNATSTTNTFYGTVSSSVNLQLASWTQIGILGIIRTIFGWFLWLVFVFYVFQRFKHFSLHG